MPDVEGLFAANLDPEAAAESFKERAVGPYRGVLPERAIASMEEQLPGACTVEIAAFNDADVESRAERNMIRGES
jgi:arsenite/tail-anchored protein-transporting ATPase